MPFVQPWVGVDFGPDYPAVATVGYRLFQADGTDSVARTTAGVVDVSGNGAYGVASVSIPDNAVGIEWDTGDALPVYAVEDIEPFRTAAASGASAADAVWGADLTAHEAEDTAGWALRVALGRIGDRMIIDTMSYDPQHQLTTSRIRVFKDEADTAAAKAGGSPVPLAEWTTTGTWSGVPGELESAVQERA